jgi:hypothetical protein
MAGQKRVGGLIALKIDGNQYNAKGNFTYNLGRAKREGVIGGEITDNDGLDLTTLLDATDVVVTLQLGTGKVIVLNHAWFAGEGTGNTEEGNIGIRFEADSGREIA